MTAQIVPNFRIRTVPVLGTTPAIFGMAAASWVLCELALKPYIPEPIFYIKVRALVCETSKTQHPTRTFGTIPEVVQATYLEAFLHHLVVRERKHPLMSSGCQQCRL